MNNLDEIEAKVDKLMTASSNLSNRELGIDEIKTALKVIVDTEKCVPTTRIIRNIGVAYSDYKIKSDIYLELQESLRRNDKIEELIFGNTVALIRREWMNDEIVYFCMSVATKKTFDTVYSTPEQAVVGYIADTHDASDFAWSAMKLLNITEEINFGEKKGGE